MSQSTDPYITFKGSSRRNVFMPKRLFDLRWKNMEPLFAPEKAYRLIFASHLLFPLKKCPLCNEDLTIAITYPNHGNIRFKCRSCKKTLSPYVGLSGADQLGSKATRKVYLIWLYIVLCHTTRLPLEKINYLGSVGGGESAKLRVALGNLDKKHPALFKELMEQLPQELKDYTGAQDE